MKSFKVLPVSAGHDPSEAKVVLLEQLEARIIALQRTLLADVNTLSVTEIEYYINSIGDDAAFDSLIDEQKAPYLERADQLGAEWWEDKESGRM